MRVLEQEQSTGQKVDNSIVTSQGISPHEFFFGLFLIIAATKLAAKAGVTDIDTLIYLSAIFLHLGLAIASRISPGNSMRRTALWFYPAALHLLFPLMKQAFPKVEPCKYDFLLQYWDSFLTPVNLSVWINQFATPWLTDILSACYQLFFPYLLICIFSYLRKEIGLAEKFTSGLFTIYGIGFIGYLLLPAVGPWLAMTNQFAGPLPGNFLTNLNTNIVILGTNLVDVFPSLHCAVTAYLLAFDFKHCRLRFNIMLLPCLGLWISTIYLRYHYLTDVLCGFALALFGFWMANFFTRPTPSHSNNTNL